MKEQILPTLVPELFQTERSAVSHGRREAQRWRNLPPGVALAAVSEHATQVMPFWEAACRARGWNGRGFGKAVGEAFSLTRDRVADALITAELSYRGTLLGMRHGVDVIRFIAECAAADGDGELEKLAREVLEERRNLVEGVATALAWIAARPKLALRRGGFRSLLKLPIATGEEGSSVS